MKIVTRTCKIHACFCIYKFIVLHDKSCHGNIAEGEDELVTTVTSCFRTLAKYKRQSGQAAICVNAYSKKQSIDMDICHDIGELTI